MGKKESKQTDALEVFRSAPIPVAVLKNALPAMAASLMVLIYNLADTFFIGQTHNALMVAAVSLATPVFLIFMSLGTIFGVGGTSVISRAMGEGRMEYGKKVCSFCMWGCVAASLLMMIVVFAFMTPILTTVGASEDTWGYAQTYLSIVSISGPAILLSSCYSNILRSEGRAGLAMIGQVGGNLLNVILDPILILACGWGVAGAAAATAISNIVSAVYYLTYFKWGHSILSIHPKDFSVRESIPKNVFAIGIPAALGSLLMSISSILMNGQMSHYGDMAVAGIGVAHKVTMITGMIAIGFGQGVQPLLGYCVGARNWDRFRKSMRFSVCFAFGLSLVLTSVCYLLKNQIISAFLTDPDAYSYAVQFVQILLTTSFLFGIYYVFTNCLQAMGAATAAFISSISRQGLVYIPAIFILQAIIGITGLVWAQPLADLVSLIVTIILFMVTYRRMSRKPAV